MAILLSYDDGLKKLAFLDNRTATELMFCYNRFVCTCVVQVEMCAPEHYLFCI